MIFVPISVLRPDVDATFFSFLRRALGESTDWHVSAAVIMVTLLFMFYVGLLVLFPLAAHRCEYGLLTVVEGCCSELGIENVPFALRLEDARKKIPPNDSRVCSFYAAKIAEAVEASTDGELSVAQRRSVRLSLQKFFQSCIRSRADVQATYEALNPLVDRAEAGIRPEETGGFEAEVAVDQYRGVVEAPVDGLENVVSQPESGQSSVSRVVSDSEESGTDLDGVGNRVDGPRSEASSNTHGHLNDSNRASHALSADTTGLEPRLEEDVEDSSLPTKSRPLVANLSDQKKLGLAQIWAIAKKESASARYADVAVQAGVSETDLRRAVRSARRAARDNKGLDQR